MDWNTILGGLAGGLGGASQGMQQVQDNRQQQLQNRMRQQEMDMAIDQQKRARVAQARQLLEGGQEVTPEVLKEFAQYPEFMSGIIKDPSTGKTVVQKSAQQQLIDKQIEEHALKVKRLQEEQAVADQIEAMGGSFYQQPIEDRMVMGARSGLKLPLQTPQEEMASSQKLEQARISGQMAIERERIRAMGSMANTQANIQGRQQLTQNQAMQLAIAQSKNVFGEVDPALVQLNYEKLMGGQSSEQPQQESRLLPSLRPARR